MNTPRGAKNTAELRDWPATPNGLYGQLAGDNTWDADNLFLSPVRSRSRKTALLDVTFGESFDTNTSGTPSGWTVEDSAASSNENEERGYWYVRNTSGNTASSFSRQKLITSTEYSNYLSANFYDFSFRDGRYTADLNYYLALHADDGGSPDADTYIRVNLWWDSANSLWKIRGEVNSSGSETLGSFETLSFPLAQPLYFRLTARNIDGSPSGVRRAYIGTSYLPKSQSQLLSVSNTDVYENPHIRRSISRGSGVEDYSLLGSIDFSGDA